MKGHYHLLIVSTGKDSFDRVYIQVENDEEGEAEAVGRWVETHPDMVNRQRNRDRTARKLQGSILEYRRCRPSSWYRENELGAFAPAGTSTATKKRRKA